MPTILQSLLTFTLGTGLMMSVRLVMGLGARPERTAVTQNRAKPQVPVSLRPAAARQAGVDDHTTAA